MVAAFDEAGIESRPVVTGNFTRNPVLKHLSYAPLGPLPNADKVHDDGLFVGNHHYPVGDKFDLVAEALASIS